MKALTEFPPSPHLLASSLSFSDWRLGLCQHILYFRASGVWWVVSQDKDFAHKAFFRSSQRKAALFPDSEA